MGKQSRMKPDRLVWLKRTDKKTQEGGIHSECELRFDGRQLLVVWRHAAEEPWQIEFRQEVPRRLRTKSLALAKKIALQMVLRRSLEAAERANHVAAWASSFLRTSELRLRDRRRKAGVGYD